MFTSHLVTCLFVSFGVAIRTSPVLLHYPPHFLPRYAHLSPSLSVLHDLTCSSLSFVPPSPPLLYCPTSTFFTCVLFSLPSRVTHSVHFFFSTSSYLSFSHLCFYSTTCSLLSHLHILLFPSYLFFFFIPSLSTPVTFLFSTPSHYLFFLSYLCIYAITCPTLSLQPTHPHFTFVPFFLHPFVTHTCHLPFQPFQYIISLPVLFTHLYTFTFYPHTCLSYSLPTPLTFPFRTPSPYLPFSVTTCFVPHLCKPLPTPFFPLPRYTAASLRERRVIAMVSEG